MVNLIGEDLIRVASGEGLTNLLRTPGAKLHLYRKKSIRPGRKMGHATFLAEKSDTVWESALMLKRTLGNLKVLEAAPKPRP